MDPKLCDQIQSMYNNIMLQQQNLAFTQMIAAFQAAAATTQTAAAVTVTPKIEASPVVGSPLLSLAENIPRADIECDVEIVLVRSFRESMKKIGTNLNGLHGKKFGFREVIEMASARQAYPSSPSTSAMKRNRNSYGSPMPLTPSTPITSRIEDERSSEAKKMRLDVDNLNDSNASSHHGHLQIDWTEPADEKNTLTPQIKNEQTPSTQIKMEKQEEAAVEKSSKPMPQRKIYDVTSEDYKPIKLRIDRMRAIQKKKPKFDVDSLDLTYHSNMARNFPGSDSRTEDQQARRNKNTLAARISRTKNKAYEKMLQSQSIEKTTDNISMKRKIACLRVYANSLMQLCGLADVNFSKMWEENIENLAE